MARIDADAGGTVGAISVLAALIAGWLAGLFRRSARDPYSMERYHRTMGVLSRFGQRGPDEEADPSEAPPPPTTDSLPVARAELVEEARRRSAAPSAPPQQAEAEGPTMLVFTDDALTAPVTAPGGKSRGLRGLAPHRARWLAPLLALVVIGGATAGIVVALRNPSPSGSNAAAGGHGNATTTTTTVPATSTSSTTTSTTTTTTLVTSGGAPVIASITPTAGPVGSTITLTGTGFASANGQILATFNGHPAPTRCPDEQHCTVTVPGGLSGSVVLQVKTSGGASNSVTFQYSG